MRIARIRYSGTRRLCRCDKLKRITGTDEPRRTDSEREKIKKNFHVTAEDIVLTPPQVFTMKRSDSYTDDTDISCFPFGASGKKYFYNEQKFVFFGKDKLSLRKTQFHFSQPVNWEIENRTKTGRANLSGFELPYNLPCFLLPTINGYCSLTRSSRSYTNDTNQFHGNGYRSIFLRCYAN